MNRREQQAVGLTIEGYFRCPERQQEQLEEQQKKLLRISDIFADQGWQRRLILQIYSIFKKILKRETFALLCKRLLHIWDELLENQVKKNNSNAYRNALSDIIVESYTFIFPLIFEYGFIDLILDFKVYRMLWAKYISDESFFQLRSEIQRLYRNFDLNKGFTPDNIDKIRKRFAKKRATEEEIQKYMGITQLQRRPEPSPSTERRLERDSSEDDESDVMRKRVKPDVMPHHFARQNYDGYTPEQYMYPGPNNAYQPQQQYQMPQGSAYPPRPGMPQPNFPTNFPPPTAANKNLYTTYTRPYGNTFNPPPMQHQGAHYQMQPSNPPSAQNFYPESKNALYGANYQDYSNKYPPSYPAQPSYKTPAAPYPTPPTQPTSYLSSQPTNFNYPPNPPAQRPPKMQQPSQFPLNSRDLKRQSQSPEFTPKMSRSPIHTQQQQYYAPEIYDSASTAKTQFRATSPIMVNPERSDKGKYKMLLANLKKGLSECKQCGVHFLSKENLQEHKRDHFLEAQRKFQAKEAQQIGSSLGIQKQRARAKENFDMLCTPSQWISAGTSSEGQAAYQVSIKRLPPMERTNPVFYCYFCNEDLQVNWCSQLQEWTLNNGIKVHEADRGLCVAHFDCYECFRNEDASFHTTAQLAN